MTKLCLVLRHRLLTILTFPLVRLKAVLRASWATEKFVLADPTRAILNTARGRGEGIWSGNFREFLFAFQTNHCGR